MYENILFAVEFCHSEDVVGQKVKQLAEKFQAKLFLIHAVELPHADIFPEIPNKEKSYLDHARNQLKETGQHLNVPIANQHAEIGDPTTVISEFIKQRDIDLLVIGHHEKTGIYRILGSTAYALLAHAKYEVLVIPYSTY
ncbi:MAG TPA: universal stress protein [Gammaproteobacteria bacterium]|nr:universal stress protein [Gammaproteobacteria bacterium]